MEFILGCNYWASNAGADMWRDFDKEAIDKDLDALSSHGVTHMRVFPNWRDFQPVDRAYAWRGQHGEYVKDNSPYQVTFFVGIANGIQGYMPTAEAYERGGYER